MENTTETPSPTKTADAISAVLEAERSGTPLKEVFEVPDEQLGRAEAFGYRLYKQGDYERAESIARGIVALDDGRIYPHLLLGDALLKRGTEDDTLHPEDIVDARSAFQRVLELQPGHPAASVKLARLHMQSGATDRARPLLERVVDSDAEESLRSEAEVLLELATESS